MFRLNLLMCKTVDKRVNLRFATTVLAAAAVVKIVDAVFDDKDSH